MTIHIALLILIVALAIALGAAVGWAYARSTTTAELSSRDHLLSQSREELISERARAERLMEENNGLIERSRADANVLQALSPIVKQLDQVNAKVQGLELKTTSQHSVLVNQMKRDAELSADLSQTTASLNAALRSTSARGSWGEVQLRRVIEAAGMLERVDFDAQVSSAAFMESSPHSTKASTSRPDVIVHLPGGGHIPIDAKVPMDAYLLAQEISPTDLDGASERQQLLQQHAKALRSHVNALIKRNYAGDFPESPQITVLFLPSEALLAEAIGADATLLDHALSAGILLTAPSSLLALLRSVAAVWSSAAASTEAREIVALGRTLVERLSTVVVHLNKLGKSLGNSVNHYNAALSSLESRLLVTARSFDSFKDSGSELGDARLITDDAAQIRDFTSPEFHAVLAEERGTLANGQEEESVESKSA